MTCLNKSASFFSEVLNAQTCNYSRQRWVNNLGKISGTAESCDGPKCAGSEIQQTKTKTRKARKGTKKINKPKSVSFKSSKTLIQRHKIFFLECGQRTIDRSRQPSLPVALLSFFFAFQHFRLHFLQSGLLWFTLQGERVFYWVLGRFMILGKLENPSFLRSFWL